MAGYRDGGSGGSVREHRQQLPRGGAHRRPGLAALFRCLRLTIGTLRDVISCRDPFLPSFSDEQYVAVSTSVTLFFHVTPQVGRVCTASDSE
eukprot:3112946-Prymnesium_polylepis.2